VRSALGFAAAKATPDEVVRAILKAPVDLLFFGGIGTYVRASSETDDAVGDRGNDPVRITSADVRAKVIGEGANLGMTQRGRIEAALRGVRLNTDAIDNSAGVNTSDVEVNIKMALARPIRDGRLSREARDALLAEMTEDVALLVLRNNYLQTLAISLAEWRGLEDLGFEQRLMQTLEMRHMLDRAVEFLPYDEELAVRHHRGQALTRPELAILLAHAKLMLKSDLVDSSVPDDPYLTRDLERYFPPAVTERFGDAIERHPLRREIIAGQLTDSMINRGGPSLMARIADAIDAAPDRIAVAFATVRDSFRLLDLNDAIDALDNKIDREAQLALYVELQNLLLDRMVWFLRHVDLGQGLKSIINRYQADVETVAQVLDRVLPNEIAVVHKARIEDLRKSGIPTALAHRLANLHALTAATDVALVAKRTGKLVTDLAATYFATVAFFRLDRIVTAARDIILADNSDRLALDRALDQIGDALRRLIADMTNAGAPGRDAVERWAETRARAVERTRLAVHEIAASAPTLSRIAVAASLLDDLAG
jgi:glutamate dehydrogenase